MKKPKKSPIVKEKKVKPLPVLVRVTTDPNDPVYVAYLELTERLAAFGVKKKSIFIGVKCSENFGLLYKCSLWAYKMNFTFTCYKLSRLPDFTYNCLDKYFPMTESGVRVRDERYFQSEPTLVNSIST